jgi:sugar phosphate isomerase/epimerase
MLSIQMYTLRNSMKTREDLENTLRRVAEMGYDSVQITPPAFLSMEEMAQMLKKNGLRADSAIRKLYEIPDHLDECLHSAEALGTNVLRTDSICREDRLSRDGYLRAAAHLEKCGRALHARGLQFMYHFHSFEFVKLGDTRGIDILLENTSPEYVLFQPDVFWLTAAGTEPSTELLKFKGRARYMHLKDYVIVPTELEKIEQTARASAPVGTGNLNLAAILAVAREMGIENFVAEDDMGILDPFESAAMSLVNMKKLGFG